MRALIPDEREPITPLVARVRELWEDYGVSTVIVAGGSGAFIDVADTVIAMDSYTPHDVTSRAEELREQPTAAEPTEAVRQLGERVLHADLPDGGDAGRGARRGGAKGHGRGPKPPKPPRARGRELIQVGKDDLDLRAL